MNQYRTNRLWLNLAHQESDSKLQEAFAARVRDISEVLLELNLPALMKHPVPAVATYHDACHLAHAQRVTQAPRDLLAAVPSLTLIPLPESDTCCGAAGTYNLEHPEMAGDLATRKLRNIEQTGASLCLAGNIGCAMHLNAQAPGRVNVVHPIQIWHRAVFGESAND